MCCLFVGAGRAGFLLPTTSLQLDVYGLLLGLHPIPPNPQPCALPPPSGHESPGLLQLLIPLVGWGYPDTRTVPAASLVDLSAQHFHGDRCKLSRESLVEISVVAHRAGSASVRAAGRQRTPRRKEEAAVGCGACSCLCPALFWDQHPSRRWS